MALAKTFFQSLIFAALLISLLLAGEPSHPSISIKADETNGRSELKSPAETFDKSRQTAEAALLHQPLSFEATERPNQFLFRGLSYQLLLTPSQTKIALKRGSRERVLSFKLAGANASAEAQAIDPLPSKRNYLIGNQPEKWRTDVPTYARVRYEGVYPGIDLIYYGRQNRLEYDFQIAPGADPHNIRFVFGHELQPHIAPNGDLVVRFKGGELREPGPKMYQEFDGARQIISGRYVLAGKREVAFDVGPYDHDQALIIDPTLIYSTYLGGSGDDIGNSIAVDASSNIYVAGTTSSTNFPTAGAAFPKNAGLGDIFVTKISANGGSIVYSTYIGGSGLDRGDGIAIDNNGNAYVVGRVDSSSTDFPTTPGALATTYRGGDFDGVVFKLNAQGNGLVYSTYLGGEENDSAEGIAVDSAGNAYITGGTKSRSFPVTNSGVQGFLSGDTDAFLTKLNANGSALLYSTMLGGTGTDRGSGIAIDSSGNAYIAGFASSQDFPTVNAFQNSPGGSFDAFVAKIDTNATGVASLVFCTYFGGAGDDKAYGIAIDSAANNIYVTGQTSSNDFPVLNPAQAMIGGSFDAFIAKISTAGAKVYTTYLGGSGDDRATGIAVNSAGAVYVTGFTSSANFPTVSPLQSSNAGGYDAFVAKLNAAGSAFLYSTYLGGAANENAVSAVTSTNTIALDISGNAYVTGYTSSSNFPTRSPIQPARSGGQDAFIARISDSTGGNQIDNTDFFVHQQYLDFLSREPDPTGFAFWMSNITPCGTDAQCIAVKRINVSNAFLVSIEFQQTGYLVERMYKVAFGSASGVSTLGGTHQLSVPIVRFNEFLPDTEQLGLGLIVGQTGWEQVLENNKQNFTTQFVQRSRFAAALPISMTPAQFVDQLNTNAGAVLSSTERATAIGFFGSASDTSNMGARTQALRQVAENQNLYTSEFNRAFVLMQYFGYLRRNPNDAPEATLDYTGYEFWLNKLNFFNGDFQKAEMVKAFITSSEYRQRFGP